MFLLNKRFIAYPIAIALLIGAMLLGISIGTVSVPVLTILKLIGSEVLHLPFIGKTDPMFTTIV
ncbi:ABC transporter permease, partial [Pseudalkalibacillus hwajinpoensis]